jgi:EAL domain-containing protein (putative c-di-GMP-specific phosphodiesterase class I)
MAHSLGLRVVAEGVETAEQQRFLLQHGCDDGAGLLLSRPLNAEDCLRFMQEWRPKQEPARLDPVAPPP